MKARTLLLRYSNTAFTQSRFLSSSVNFGRPLHAGFCRLSFGQTFLHQFIRASSRRPSLRLLERYSTSTSETSSSSNFECPDCQHSFFNYNALASHRFYDCAVALLPRTHICEACSKSFGSHEQLRKHQTQRCRVGLADVWGTFRCDACHRMYANPASLRRHKCPGRVISCTSCKRLFSSEPALAKHMAVHDPARLYACPTCDARFPHQSTLVRHISAAHMNPVSCDICNTQFVNEDSLSIHQTRYHRSKKARFQCAMCDFKTKYPFSLKRHEALHKSKDTIPEAGLKTVNLDIDREPVP